MITIDKLKDFKISKERFIVPVDKEDIHKSSCVIMFTRHRDSILSVLNNPFMDDKNLFKHIYRSRDFDIRIKADKFIEKGTKSRNEYYEMCREKLKLSGIVSLSNLGMKNFYFDTYREHEIFLDNSGKLTKLMRSSEYVSMLNKYILGLDQIQEYKAKTVLIQLEDWVENVSEDNPCRLLHYASWKLFDHFKTLGDIDFVFITKEAVFKMNPSRCSNTSHVEFLKALKTLNKTVVLDDNEDGNIAAMINAEIGVNDDESVVDDELAEKIRKQEEQGKSPTEIANDIVNDPEEAKKIADKVMEPIAIKTDAISKRDKELREKQKSLKLDGVSMSELHDRKVDHAEIPVNDVSGSVNTLNKNITRVQFVNFPETYNKHYYQRDIMSIADAMKDKSIPVFVRDMKREDTSDSLNQKITYTFYLEDSNRGRHTLKFDMPKFVEGKYMYLNGHKKEFNNQRIAKPLIKTGPDTVQVVTNYNKIFMTRHGEKVEALYEKFKELVISDPKHFSYKRGDCSRLNAEYKTSIEYDTLAKQFAEITVKPPIGDRLHLIFSQPKLKELCCGKLGCEGLWKQIQESGTQMVAGYYENPKKCYLYTLELNSADVTVQESVTMESIGDAFPAFEYVEA